MNIPLNIDWRQILLHLMNFAILAGGLYFLLYQPVKKFMDKRTAYYQSLEDDAQKSLREAEQLKADYAAKLQNAEEELHQERVKAQAAARHTADQQLAQANAQAETILADARAAAARSMEKARKDSQKELQELAVTAAEKLVLQSGGDAFDQFLETAERGMRREQQSKQ